MICIIPQHGGSRRLPSKATRPFCGRSLIEFAVAQSMAAKSIDEVYVSTDSDVVADLCEPMGAKIIWRPPEIRDKKFSAAVPICHAIDVIGEAAQNGPVMSRLASSPLLKPGDLDRMYDCYMRAPDAPEGMLKQAGLAVQTQEVVFYRVAPSLGGVKRLGPGLVDKTHRTIAKYQGCNVMDGVEFGKQYDRVGWVFGTDRYHDTDVREGISDHETYMLGMAMAGGLCYYDDCELWQTFDIDDDEGFKLCEALAENFILKGRTLEEVYVR